MSEEATDAPGASTPATSPPPAAQPTAKSTESSAPDDEKRLSSDDARGENQALFTGARYFTHSGTRYGPALSIGSLQTQDMQVGDRYQIFVGQTVERTVGAVRQELLRWVRERYFQVDRYLEFFSGLEERHLLVLRGRPGTGRVTTALHLLDRLAPNQVSRWECGKTAKSLTRGKFDRKNVGYLAELSPRVSGGLTETILDDLQKQLKDSKSYGVLVIPEDPRDIESFGGYAFDYQAPEPSQLLRKHIQHEILPDDPPGFEEKLLRLSEADWAMAALGPCPCPLESVRMAALLAQHARGEIDRDEVEREAERAVHFQVAEWFAELLGLTPGAELDEALRLAAFRIALAVLNRSPYTVVTEAADLLTRKLVGNDDKAKKDKRQGSLFADDQGARLPALRARIIDGHATFGRELIPMELLEFHDPRYPTAVLDHVWKNHHRLREQFGPWFKELGKDSRPMMWVRAAQATGYLGRHDFVYVYTKMISPNASSDEWKDFLFIRRRSAAIALDQAAQDDEIRPAILERLRKWRRYGTPEERWTAAATYGFALGRRDIRYALEELRVLGTPSERRMPLTGDADSEIVWIAGFSVAKLLAFGRVTEVLDHLHRWLASDRSSLRRLALTSLKHLASFYGFELDYLWLSMEDDRPVLPPHAERWPLLLALSTKDADVARRVTGLLTQALRSREGDTLARFLLARWVRSGEHDSALLDELARFMTGLVAHAGDAQRLHYLLNRLVGDWADPLQPKVADQLSTAVKEGEQRRTAA